MVRSNWRTGSSMDTRPQVGAFVEETGPDLRNSVKATWEELNRLGRESGSEVDVGPQALRRFPDEATAPKAQGPLLLRTHMDAWAQTSPEPVTQPAIAWFLHGMDLDRQAAPDVSILWRWDRAAETLRLVPPRQAEFLQVPIYAAKSWLATGPEVEVSDVAQAEPRQEKSPTSDDNAGIVDCVRWLGFGQEPESIGEAHEIRPGDILIVDPSPRRPERRNMGSVLD